MKNQIAFTALALLVLLPASLPGCPCNPDNDEPFCEFLSDLTDLAYGLGSDPPADAPPRPICPFRLVCQAPYCIEVHENSSFERFDPRVFASPHLPYSWFGNVGESIFLRLRPCEGARALEFLGTTHVDFREIDHVVSEIYQIVSYKDLAPPSELSLKRRVRVQASFFVGVEPAADLDDKFGIRIDAYKGDPDTFPTIADHEIIPASDPEGNWELLTYSRSSFRYDFGGPDWQPLRAELNLPEETDFFVVILEAHENRRNDRPGDFRGEFEAHYVDRVDIVIDGGPYGPIASPDSVSTIQGRGTRILVLRNDENWDGRFLPNTLEVVSGSGPANGTAVVDNVAILYTPEPGFTGTDRFTYVVADDNGLRAGAPVTVTVLPGTNRPPVAVADAVNVTPGVATELDLLANDYDPDGDAISIAAVGNPPNGTVEIINNGQAVRYTPNTGFTGADIFAYLIADEHGAGSNEVVVAITVASG